MNKFITLSTIIGLLTTFCPSIHAAPQEKDLKQISESTQMYMRPLPLIIPVCCPACKRPCGFMGLTSCKCYKDRLAAQAAEKEAALKEAALAAEKEAAKLK